MCPHSLCTRLMAYRHMLLWWVYTIILCLNSKQLLSMTTCCIQMYTSSQLQEALWATEGVEDRDWTHPAPAGEGQGPATEGLWEMVEPTVWSYTKGVLSTHLYMYEHYQAYMHVHPRQCEWWRSCKISPGDSHVLWLSCLSCLSACNRIAIARNYRISWFSRIFFEP